MTITSEQRQHIRELAGNCCEYCRVAQDDRLSKFQIDHIIPLKHGGSDDTENLSLACLKCNSYCRPMSEKQSTRWQQESEKWVNLAIHTKIHIGTYRL